MHSGLEKTSRRSFFEPSKSSRLSYIKAALLGFAAGAVVVGSLFGAFLAAGNWSPKDDMEWWTTSAVEQADVALGPREAQRCQGEGSQMGEYEGMLLAQVKNRSTE